MERFVGLDFGTTNSALAVAGAGEPVLARFRRGAEETSTFRSILYFDPQERDARGQPRAVAGPGAIERYLAADGSGRLIQSLKSYLSTGLFQSTMVFGRSFTIEELIALILRGLRSGAEATLGPLGERVVVGRPVRFAGAETPADEALALGRLRAALAAVGFSEVEFEYEPVGAAWHYERRLDHDELVLIADFGGGTSDFCLMRVGPSARRLRASGGGILGTEGVALAGDAFDSELVAQVVAPPLGYGSSFRSYLDGKLIPVPSWLYAKLRRWHHLSFLKSGDTLRFLWEVHAQALEPAKIAGLIHLVEYDLGYRLYEAVEASKVGLSTRERVRFALEDPPLRLASDVARADFEAWIARELGAIEGCVERLLARVGVAAGEVDQVFMTGGSSQVPAVRRIFERRFGGERIRAGDELTSVAMGLAERAAALVA